MGTGRSRGSPRRFGSPAVAGAVGGLVCALGSALLPLGGPTPVARAASVPEWVHARPPQVHVPRTADNPCRPSDPGLGAYADWVPVTKLGLLLPFKDLTLPPDGGFDLLVHFHGGDSARREVVSAGGGMMLVTLDAGVRSGAYARELQGPGSFAHLIERTEARVRELSGRKDAKLRRLAVSAWSAGYGAVGQILGRREQADRVDTVILLDSLHTAYDRRGELFVPKLAPFVDFARRAAAGERLMVVSHSAIIPPGYASTTETSRYLIWKTGGRPTLLPHDAPKGPTSPFEEFRRQGLVVRGYLGTNRRAHCAQLGLLSDVIREQLRPRWSGHAE